MAKIIQFSTNQPSPEKFGLQPVRRKKAKERQERPGQLNLFSGARVVKLNQLTKFEEALLMDEQGDRKTARQQYLQCIEEGESIADAYCNLGILDSQEGQFTKAINSFTLSLKHDPRHYEAHYNLANIYSEAGNFALARIHYQVSIDIEPTFYNGYYNLALCLAMNKEYADAVKILREYRQLSPDEDHQHTDDLISSLSEIL